jgi:hypothetical protein
MKPEERAQIKMQTEMEGGGDPSIVYLFNHLSCKHGPVYLFRAKLPTSGELRDDVFDMMVPLVPVTGAMKSLLPAVRLGRGVTRVATEASSGST